MRPSEYLGLTWNDVDLDRGTVSVSHTLEWRKGGWQFAETKRSRSRRLVKLQTWVVALLREQVLKEKEARGDALVFRAQRGGPIRESRFVQDHFKPLLKSAELPAIAECATGAWILSPRTGMCAPCAPFISQTTQEADKRNVAAYDAGKS
jgi:integrase